MRERSRSPAPCRSAPASGLILPLHSGLNPAQGTAVQKAPAEGGLGESGWQLLGGAGLPKFMGWPCPRLPMRWSGAAGEAPGAFLFLSPPSYSRKLSLHALRQTLPFGSAAWYPATPKQIHPSRAARSHSPHDRILPPRPR